VVAFFSNLIVTDSEEEAQKLAAKTFSKELIEEEKTAKKAYDEKNKPAETASTPTEEEPHGTEDLDEDEDEKEEL